MINWKFKENIEPVGTSNDFWYDLTLGGYIIPEKILADKNQIKIINETIKILQSFEEALTENDLLNEF